MGHKHNQHRKKKRKTLAAGQLHRGGSAEPPSSAHKSLEVILKCNSEGSREAIIRSVREIVVPGITVSVISSGVGEITRSDLFMAETASRLIIGYEIDVNRATEKKIMEFGVEVRVYQVIYRLLEDLKHIGESLVAESESERILGRAKVIALFKSCRKGIILGCEVLEGRLARGDRFRVVGAMGQIYTGRIDSLHRENDVVDSAGKGSQVGLKIQNFNKALIGDLVESFKRLPDPSPEWAPTPGVQVVV